MVDKKFTKLAGSSAPGISSSSPRSSVVSSKTGGASPAGFVGCNTYGQIARAEGQFGGFHNCTAVVCVLPA